MASRQGHEVSVVADFQDYEHESSWDQGRRDWGTWGKAGFSITTLLPARKKEKASSCEDTLRKTMSGEPDPPPAHPPSDAGHLRNVCDDIKEETERTRSESKDGGDDHQGLHVITTDLEPSENLITEEVHREHEADHETDAVAQSVTDDIFDITSTSSN